MSTPSHDTDFFGWTCQQAHLLRTGRLDQLDAAPREDIRVKAVRSNGIGVCPAEAPA